MTQVRSDDELIPVRGSWNSLGLVQYLSASS